MEQYVNYEGDRITFSIPKSWNLISDQDKPPVPGVPDPLKEIQRALENPIGSPPVEEIARPGMQVALLFDDLERPTPAYLALPEIMNRLNRAGIPDERITGICAVATHRVHTMDQLREKAGKEAFTRLEGRIFSHDAKAEDQVVIGRTHRGVLVEINKHVAYADLIIGVGECMPHPSSGYGGGCKIVMPGVASYRSVADHHFTFMRHPNGKVNVLEGNPFYEEILDAGRLSRLHFKLDLIINHRKEVIRAFAGDPAEEHREASRYAASLYLVPLSSFPDVTITSASPLEFGVQATKALHMASFCTRSGGTIIWVASQKEAGPIMPLIKEMASPDSATESHRRLYEGDIPDHLQPFGISYIMQVVFFKKLAEDFNIIHVTEGLSREQVEMMGFTFSPDLPTAIQAAADVVPRADVAIFPSGGNIIPGIA
jgi:nickel-dependent lactate racemase